MSKLLIQLFKSDKSPPTIEQRRAVVRESERTIASSSSSRRMPTELKDNVSSGLKSVLQLRTKLNLYLENPDLLGLNAIMQKAAEVKFKKNKCLNGREALTKNGSFLSEIIIDGEGAHLLAQKIEDQFKGQDDKLDKLIVGLSQSPIERIKDSLRSTLETMRVLDQGTESEELKAMKKKLGQEREQLAGAGLMDVISDDQKSVKFVTIDSEEGRSAADLYLNRFIKKIYNELNAIREGRANREAVCDKLYIDFSVFSDLTKQEITSSILKTYQPKNWEKTITKLSEMEGSILDACFKNSITNIVNKGIPNLEELESQRDEEEFLTEIRHSAASPTTTPLKAAVLGGDGKSSVGNSQS